MTKRCIILGFFLLISLVSHSQRIWGGEYNRLGIQAGVNHFDIHTGNFNITPGTSWTAGFTGRANYYNDFQLIYGLNFFDFNAKISGREFLEDMVANEDILFNMIGVQASLLGSYEIIGNYFSVEAGPVLQLNGKFDPRLDKELLYVEEYNIQAVDIEKVSTFNFNVAAGISGGFRNVKFFAQFQYGVNNFFGGLNQENLEDLDPRVIDVSGNLNVITGGVIVFL